MIPEPTDLFLDDAGMITMEYAVGVLAAVALAAALYAVTTSEPVMRGIASMIEGALDFSG